MKFNLNKKQNNFFKFFSEKDVKNFSPWLNKWISMGPNWIKFKLWLKEDGLSRSTIGWAGLIFSVYAFNYLWAPLVDKIKIPILSKKLGIENLGYFACKL